MRAESPHASELALTTFTAPVTPSSTTIGEGAAPTASSLLFIAAPISRYPAPTVKMS